MGKLVRDRIPDIIRDAGGTPSYVVLTGDELHHALKVKLVEEARELLDADESGEAEELADVLEVVETLLQRIDRVRVADVGSAKRLSRGGFQRGYYLE